MKKYFYVRMERANAILKKIPILKGEYNKNMIGKTCDLIDVDNNIMGADLTSSEKNQLLILSGKKRTVDCIINLGSNYVRLFT